MTLHQETLAALFMVAMQQRIAMTEQWYLLDKMDTTVDSISFTVMDATHKYSIHYRIELSYAENGAIGAELIDYTVMADSVCTMDPVSEFTQLMDGWILESVMVAMYHTTIN